MDCHNAALKYSYHASIKNDVFHGGRRDVLPTAFHSGRPVLLTALLSTADFSHKNYRNNHTRVRLRSKSALHAHAVPSGYSPLRCIRPQRRRNRRNNRTHEHTRNRSVCHEHDTPSGYSLPPYIRPPRRRNRRNNRTRDHTRNRSDRHGCAGQYSHSLRLYKARIPDPPESLSVHDAHEPIQALP